MDLARKFAPVRPSPEAQAVSEYDRWDAAPLEAATPHSEIAFMRGKPSEPARRDLEATQTSGFWTRTASTLAPAGAALLFGAALFVGAFGPKGGSTGGRSHITQPALVKIVGSEQLPTAVYADAPAASSAPSEPSPTDLAAPTPVAPPAMVPPVVAVDKITDSRSGVSQSAESNPVRAMSAPPEATAALSATQASVAAPPDAPQRPAEAAPMAENKVVPGVQPPPNLDRPTKLSGKTQARVIVAKIVATAPHAATETRRQPQRPGASTIPLPPAAPRTTAASAAAQEPVNVFSALADQTASGSGDFAIQFAAPKSEAEAEVVAVRLNAKYAPALNGATIGIHKTQVNGETIYALRVAGLSKADATALCVRVSAAGCRTDGLATPARQGATIPQGR